MNCYIHGDRTFELKIHAVVVWGGGNLYNLDEMKKLNQYMRKVQYHLIAAISVELLLYVLHASALSRRLYIRLPMAST